MKSTRRLLSHLPSPFARTALPTHSLASYCFHSLASHFSLIRLLRTARLARSLRSSRERGFCRFLSDLTHCAFPSEHTNTHTHPHAQKIFKSVQRHQSSAQKMSKYHTHQHFLRFINSLDLSGVLFHCSTWQCCTSQNVALN